MERPRPELWAPLTLKLSPGQVICCHQRFWVVFSRVSCRGASGVSVVRDPPSESCQDGNESNNLRVCLTETLRLLVQLLHRIKGCQLGLKILQAVKATECDQVKKTSTTKFCQTNPQVSASHRKTVCQSRDRQTCCGTLGCHLEDA